MTVLVDARFDSGLDSFSAGTHVTNAGSADINDAAGVLLIAAGQTSTRDFTNITSGKSRLDFSYKVTDSSVAANASTLIYALANGVTPASASSLATLSLDRSNSASSSVLRLTYRNTTTFVGIQANGADLSIRRGDYFIKLSVVIDHSAKTYDIYVEDVLFVKGIAWPNSSAAGFGRIAIVSQASAPDTWFDSIKVQDSWADGDSVLIDHDFVGGSGEIETTTPQTSTRNAHPQKWVIAPDTTYGGFTVGANGAAPVASKKCFALQRCGANGVLEAEFKTPSSGTAYIGMLFRFWDYPSSTGAGAGVLRVSGSGNTAALFIPDRSGTLQTAVSTAYTLSANTTYTLKLEMRGRVYVASIKAAAIDAGSYTVLFTHTADTSAKGGRGMLIEELAGPFVDCSIGAATNYVRRFRFSGSAEASEATRTIGLKYALGHGSIKEMYVPDSDEPTRNLFWSRGIQYGHRSSADMCGNQQQAILFDAANVYACRQTGANVTEYQHIGKGDCYVTLLRRGPWVSDGIQVFDNSENFAPDWDLLPSHWDKGFRTIQSTGSSTLRSDATYHDWTTHTSAQALPAGHQSLTAFASGQQYRMAELLIPDVGTSGSIFDVTSKLEGSGDPISRAVSTSGTNLSVSSSYRVARAFFVQAESALSDAQFVTWRDDLKTPATLTMTAGTRKLDAAGDMNTDGFNERHGWYEINCASGAAEFTLPIASGARHMPAFRLHGWTSTNTSATINGTPGVVDVDFVIDEVASGVAVLQLLDTYTADVSVVVTSDSTTTTVSPGAGHAVLSGYQPTIAQSDNRSVSPGAGHGAFTGHQPTVTVGNNITVSPLVGHGNYSGYMPIVQQSAGVVVAPGAGHGLFSGHQPTIEQPITVSPGAGHMAFAGYAPTVTVTAGQVISPGAAHLVAAGGQPIVVRTDNRTISPGTGHGVFAGHAPSVSISSPGSMTEETIAAAVIAALRAASPPVPVECDCPTTKEISDAVMFRDWP